MCKGYSFVHAVPFFVFMFICTVIVFLPHCHSSCYCLRPRIRQTFVGGRLGVGLLVCVHGTNDAGPLHHPSVPPGAGRRCWRGTMPLKAKCLSLQNLLDGRPFFVQEEAPCRARGIVCKPTPVSQDQTPTATFLRRLCLVLKFQGQTTMLLSGPKKIPRPGPDLPGSPGRSEPGPEILGPLDDLRVWSLPGPVM